LVIFSHFYYKYLEGDKKIPILGSFVLAVILLLLIHVVLSWLFFQVWGLPLIMFYLLFVIFLIVVVFGEMPRCTNVRTRSLGDDVKFEECLNGPINAWYNPLKKKIFVGDKILKFLDENELKAVYYHEEGHSRYGFWRLILNRSLFVVWIVFYLVGLTSFLFYLLGSSLFYLLGSTLLIYWFGDVLPLLLNLLLYSFFVALVSSPVIILCLWYGEHEADIYSLKKLAAAEPMISALIKLHVYSILRDWVELKVRPKRTESSLVFRKRDIFALLFRESIGTALKIIEISSLIKNPLPLTHPPLRLRIYKILREL
jgi:Zn-dependent protease with chaperone function